MSSACVTDGERISDTFAIWAAFGVVDAEARAVAHRAGAVVIVGRGPLKRYGGE